MLLVGMAQLTPVPSEMWPCILLCSLAIFTDSVFGACGKGVTTVNGGREVCERKVIFEDDFTGETRDVYKNWRQSIRFSDYPDYEFNMYDRLRNNFMVSEGVLSLIPALIPQISKDEEFLYKGEFDLNDYPPKPAKCTKKPDSGYCKRKANGYQILPPVVAPRIYSKVAFRYGSVEVRAKVPKGDWIYPEIEIAPVIGNSRYGKQSGRIIIAMVRGNEDLRFPDTDERINFGVNWLEAGVFAGTYNPRTATHIVASINETAWSQDFHTYRVDWEPGTLTFFVDGVLIGQAVKTGGLLGKAASADAPVDEEMVVALGVGVGGIQRFPDGLLSSGSPKPWKNLSPKAMMHFWRARSQWYPTWKPEDIALKVDYVRVWSRELKTYLKSN